MTPKEILRQFKEAQQRPVDVSSAIRELMKLMDLRLGDLSNRLDVDPRTLRRWLSEGIPPRRSNLLALIQLTESLIGADEEKMLIPGTLVISIDLLVPSDTGPKKRHLKRVVIDLSKELNS